MWQSIILAIVDLLVNLGIREKQKADAEEADALSKTLDSIKDSLTVEKKIRDKQAEVRRRRPSVETQDGDLSFDGWNNGDSNP